MAFDFLVPVKDKVLAHSELLPEQALGKNVHMHTEKDGLPVFAQADVAIFGVLESRNAFEKKPEKLDLDEVRIQLYRLMMGNWNSTIIDIGDVEEGNTVEDTYFVVKEIVAGLLEENIIPIVLGLTQDITFPTYRAFDKIKKYGIEIKTYPETFTKAKHGFKIGAMCIGFWTEDTCDHEL